MNCNIFLQFLKPDGKKDYTYDKKGGIVEDRTPSGTCRFTYNSRHQQAKAENENGGVQDNRYDAFGVKLESTKQISTRIRATPRLLTIAFAICAAGEIGKQDIIILCLESLCRKMCIRGVG